MLYSHRYFFPTKRKHLQEGEKQSLISKMLELENNFFQEHKKGDSDRWHPDTPRLNQCDRYEFIRDKQGFTLVGILESELKLFAFIRRKQSPFLMFSEMEFMHFWWTQHRLDNPDRPSNLISA